MPRTSALAALILTSCSSASGAARLQLATIAATLHASLPRASPSTCLGLGSGLRFGLEGWRVRGAWRAWRAWGVRSAGGCGGCARGLCCAVVGHRLDVHRLSDGKRTGVCHVLLRVVCGRACVAAEAMRRVSWRLVRERVCGQPIRAAGHRLLRTGTYRRAERLEEGVEGLAGDQEVVVAVDDPGGQRHH